MVINDPFVQLLLLLPLEGAPPSPFKQTHPFPLDVGVVGSSRWLSGPRPCLSAWGKV